LQKVLDGKYYRAGNNSDDDHDIAIWTSADHNMEKHSTYTPNLKSTPGYVEAMQRIGAPKLYYDEPSSKFIVTCHTPHQEGTREDGERYWASKRTLYVVSKDLKTFEGTPRKLFDWNFGTIDVLRTISRRILRPVYSR